MACKANKARMALRVGSAIAWKISLLMINLQLFDCKYSCNHLVAQIFSMIFPKRAHHDNLPNLPVNKENNPQAYDKTP